jgi:hypothetical protein
MMVSKGLDFLIFLHWGRELCVLLIYPQRVNLQYHVVDTQTAVCASLCSGVMLHATSTHNT